jgi:hypothetical protein
MFSAKFQGVVKILRILMLVELFSIHGCSAQAFLLMDFGTLG